MVYTVTDDSILEKSVKVIKEIINGVVKQLLAYYVRLEAFPKSPLLCTSAVEIVLFHDLFERIFSMYKIRYKKDDALHTKKIQEFSSITPAHFGIRTTLWLLNVSLNHSYSEFYSWLMIIGRMPLIRCLTKRL